MGNLLPIPNHFSTTFTDFNMLTNKVDKTCESDIPWLDDDIVDSFSPSRLPPRVAKKLPAGYGSRGKGNLRLDGSARRRIAGYGGSEPT